MAFAQNFMVSPDLFQWWPFLLELLPWQNSVHWSVLCVTGMRRFSGRCGTGCDGYGEIHPAAWLWPAVCRDDWRVHGEAQGQICPWCCADTGVTHLKKRFVLLRDLCWGALRIILRFSMCVNVICVCGDWLLHVDIYVWAVKAWDFSSVWQYWKICL